MPVEGFARPGPRRRLHLDRVDVIAAVPARQMLHRAGSDMAETNRDLSGCSQPDRSFVELSRLRVGMRLRLWVIW